MIVSGTGAQASIVWKGGDGTISLTPITANMNLPRTSSGVPGVPDEPTVPGSVGDWAASIWEFEASFNNGETWDSMSDSGAVVQFKDGGVEAKNFSSAACLIRANNVNTAPSGIGLLLGIGGRGQ